MVQTALDICNLAIVGKVGGDPIDEIGENTPLGAFCATAYPAKRDFVMGKHRWVFAKTIAQLARRTEAPVGCPMANAFTLPGDLVGSIHAFRDGPREDARNLRTVQMSDYVACDEAVVWVEYTAAKPESTWPVWFRELVVTAFGADVARQCMQAGKGDALDRQAFGSPADNGEGGLYLSAKMEDARGAPQRQLFYDSDGPLLEARRGYGCSPFSGPLTVLIGEG